MKLRLPDLVTTLSPEPPLIARVTGVLFGLGATLVLLSLLSPHPAGSNDAALQAILIAAYVVGIAFVVFAARIPVWLIHATIGLGSVLVSLCVYFSGVPTAGYATMFVWVVLMSAYFFPGRPAFGHLALLLTAYALTLAALDSSGEFSAFTHWLLTAFALLIASSVTSLLVAGRERMEDTLRREMSERQRLEQELQHLADHDALTGLPNRRRLVDELARELTRSRRHGWPVCVAVLDLDGFKEFNDAYGHTAGDTLLRQAAAGWLEVLRDGDLIARFGGDEFVVLLPHCGSDEAREVIGRLRSSVPRAVTCSAGLACWNGTESPEELLERADGSLYAAKRGGRDRLTVG